MFRDKINIGDLFYYKGNPAWSRKPNKYYFLVLREDPGMNDVEGKCYMIQWIGFKPENIVPWVSKRYFLEEYILRKSCTKVNK